MNVSAKTLFFFSALLGVCIPTLTYLALVPMASLIQTPDTLENIYRAVDTTMMASGWAAFVLFVLGLINWKS